MASRYGTGATFDGSQRDMMDANNPRSAEALKCLTKFQSMWDEDAPPSRAAKRRNIRALEQLVRAADLGCAGAALNLAEIYFNGSVAGTERDIKKMFHYYVLFLEQPDEVLHECGENFGPLYLVLYNMYAAVERLEDTAPAEWLVPRLDGVLALEGWRATEEQRIGRVVLMVVNHTLGHLRWLGGDRLKAVKQLHKSTKYWEKLRAVGFGTGDAREARIMLLNFDAQRLAEKIAITNKIGKKALLARKADDDDDATELVELVDEEAVAEIDARYAALTRDFKRDSEYDSEVGSQYMSSHDGEDFVAAGAAQSVYVMCGTFAEDAELPIGAYDMRRIFCDHCGQQDALGKRLNKCPCGLVRYCDTRCQKAARKEHKTACRTALALI